MRLHRLLGILSILLSRKTISAKELSVKFQVSLRTIYRDIKAIEEAGIPLYAIPGNGGGIGIVEEYKLNKTALTGDEINYLMTGIAGLKTIADTEKLQILLMKLFPTDPYIMADLDIMIDFSAWNKNATEVLKQNVNIIRMAIMSNNYLQIEYLSSNRRSNLIIAPSKVVFKSAAWYLFGKSTVNSDFHFYKISRIVKMEIINEQFVPVNAEIPADWSDDFTNDSGEKITLAFDQSMEYRVIDIFGKDNYEQGSNGSIIVNFHCSNRNWLIHFVLGFGINIEIIYPPDLKKEYLDYIKRIILKNHC
ncbi:helix-turn-helix transcriptional regulator [Lacrimispora sp.]|jgi:predicted DNA-binding transcriptional regulator YafY|uniref:helix-turn-helix transcriptional regulator n=1 Tax=Lacrimispora sp. TaxID=2719234 RepID=UPI0028AA9CAA|nr:WYL domain-containing protein [Lacrimispora sp.]